MSRREVIAGICGAITLPMVARAQQTSVPVIGYLSSRSPESDAFRVTGLERGLNEAGYIVGRNVSIEYRWARNQFDQLPAGTEGEIDTAFVSLAGAAGARAGALMVSNDVFFNNRIAQLVPLAAR